jgi:hypothetical protein
MISKQALSDALEGAYRTLQAVGDDFGVTRERIRQLIVRYGLRRPYRRLVKLLILCDVCGDPIEPGQRAHGAKPPKHSRCIWVTMTCPCGEEFRLRRTDCRISRHSTKAPFFHSPDCYWQWREDNKGHLRKWHDEIGMNSKQKYYYRKSQGLCIVCRAPARVYATSGKFAVYCESHRAQVNQRHRESYKKSQVELC